MAAHGSILITDDDAELRRVLRMTLDALGFETAEANSGEQALRELEAHHFDVVLLDVYMPGIGGVETCRRIRSRSTRLQVLVLTVRDKEAHMIEALDAGADDYITKPFSVPELTARLRAAVRRATTSPIDTESQIVIGEIELDPARRTVRKSGVALRFTPKEFELLHYLMARAGLPLAHAKILRALWGPEYGGELEYLRTFIHQLRKKLETDPSAPEYLLTEPHFGYRFREPVSGSVAPEVPAGSK